ncbi:SPFH domain-containing protein [Nocardia speluncae]|uniref:SPFH domain-containing protein n=1 Tax=Nocardia speluncae TaxID=419477 RepID=A0A846XHS0_9NOCA|nr:SPFH domain-containing protein [Nocardia speluncae]NKY34759.1 SPFH domain-containing protein [Nocardia speluncae]
MAWFEREFIAVPETGKKQLVYKWPDMNIRRYSRAIVNADQTALFVKSGHVLGALGPGRHRVDADELPVLGALVDTLSGGNYYRAELYFVSTREFAGIKFGGRLADIADPVSEQIVTLRVFGEFALTVRDAQQLITSLAGSTDLHDPAGIESWSADLLLKSMKVAVTREVSRGEWPVLGLSGELPAIERAVLEQTNTALYEYGLRVPRLGNFDITLAPEDADRLKRLAKDVTYIRLAGDFRQYAAGEMALGAGHGLATGHGHEGGILGAALGINALQQSSPPAPGAGPAAPASPWQHRTSPERAPQSSLPPGAGSTELPAGSPPSSAAAPVCTGCNTVNPEGANFCVNCGMRLAPNRIPDCRGCGARLLATAKFCGSCGSPALPG